jgi:hypothetical protein
MHFGKIEKIKLGKFDLQKKDMKVGTKNCVRILILLFSLF